MGNQALHGSSREDGGLPTPGRRQARGLRGATRHATRSLPRGSSQVRRGQRAAVLAALRTGPTPTSLPPRPGPRQREAHCSCGHGFGQACRCAGAGTLELPDLCAVRGPGVLRRAVSCPSPGRCSVWCRLAGLPGRGWVRPCAVPHHLTEDGRVVVWKARLHHRDDFAKGHSQSTELHLRSGGTLAGHVDQLPRTPTRGTRPGGPTPWAALVCTRCIGAAPSTPRHTALPARSLKATDREVCSGADDHGCVHAEEEVQVLCQHQAHAAADAAREVCAAAGARGAHARGGKPSGDPGRPAPSACPVTTGAHHPHGPSHLRWPAHEGTLRRVPRRPRQLCPGRTGHALQGSTPAQPCLHEDGVHGSRVRGMTPSDERAAA